MTKKSNKGKDIGDSNAVADAFSAGVRPTLDLVDDLRKLGLQKDVPIPQIAVMGDQSSGKSSVLEAISGMLKVAEGRGSNETQEVQDMTDMLSAYSKLAVKRYIDEVGMALRHEMTSAERIEKMVSALEDYLHGQDSEQLKCLFEPNKLTKKKRDSLIATVGRLQKAQGRMSQGIVARG